MTDAEEIMDLRRRLAESVNLGLAVARERDGLRDALAKSTALGATCDQLARVEIRELRTQRDELARGVNSLANDRAEAAAQRDRYAEQIAVLRRDHAAALADLRERAAGVADMERDEAQRMAAINSRNPGELARMGRILGEDRELLAAFLARHEADGRKG